MSSSEGKVEKKEEGLPGDHMASASMGPPEGTALIDVGSFTLESGEELSEVTLCCSSYGTPNEDKSNVILVTHSLTSSSEVHSWWPHVLGSGPEFALDTDRFHVVCFNYVGSCYGSTSPLSTNPATGERYMNTFPYTSIRDQVSMQKLALDKMGITQLYMAIGGSFGAMVVLEFGLMFEGFVQRLVSIAGCAEHTDWAIGLGKVERMAVYNDPRWKDGNYDLSDPPLVGLSVARQMAMLSYRTPTSVSDKFQRKVQAGSPPRSGSPPEAKSASTDPVPPEGGAPPSTDEVVASLPATEPFWAIESYLNYQGDKFVKRFDPLCYVRLVKTLDTHACGRGRGDWKSAVSTLSMPVFIVGIASDMLYPVTLQTELAEAIPGASLLVLDSPHGHDGFLIELGAVNKAIIGWSTPSSEPVS